MNFQLSNYLYFRSAFLADARFLIAFGYETSTCLFFAVRTENHSVGSRERPGYQNGFAFLALLLGTNAFLVKVYAFNRYPGFFGKNVDNGAALAAFFAADYFYLVSFFYFHRFIADLR